MKRKVYCKNCKYYVPMAPYRDGDYCKKKIGEHDEAYSREIDIVSDYKKLNKDNVCGYYKRKWWKFWVKKDWQ